MGKLNLSMAHILLHWFFLCGTEIDKFYQQAQAFSTGSVLFLWAERLELEKGTDLRKGCASC